MKNILFFCSIFLYCLSGYGQRLTAPATVESGQEFTVTAEDESSARYISSLMFDPTLTTAPDNKATWVMSGITTTEQSYYSGNYIPPKKTTFKMKVSNSYTEAITATYGFTVGYTINNGTAFDNGKKIYLTVTINPSPSIFYNDVKSSSFDKQNCPAGTKGSTVTYTVPAGKYSASTKAAANQLALNEITSNGQNYANSNGQCLTLYYNSAISGSFTKNDCGNGLTSGPAISYSIAANTYSATSQAAADQAALNALNTQGQLNANANGTCVSIVYFPKLVASNDVVDPQTAYRTVDYDILIFSDEARTIPLVVPSGTISVAYQEIRSQSAVGVPLTTTTINHVATIRKGASSVSLGTFVINDCPAVPTDNSTAKKNTTQKGPIGGGGNYPCISRVIQLKELL